MSGNKELEKLFRKFEVKFTEKIDNIAVKIKSDIEILFEQKLHIHFFIFSKIYLRNSRFILVYLIIKLYDLIF